MSVLARLRSFLTTASRRQRYEDALDEEVRFHLEQYARPTSFVPACPRGRHVDARACISAAESR